jgi:hypothetical protein
MHQNMYSNMINQNPLINQFNNYTIANPSQTPFQSNQLLTENVHVMNHLGNLIQQQKHAQQVMNTYTTNPSNTYANPSNTYANSTNFQTDRKKNSNSMSGGPKKNLNIIEEMMKPQVIERGGKDVNPNFSARKEDYKYDPKNPEKFYKYKMTNQPYKSIIRDKIITKAVTDIEENDLVVHKVSAVDKDVDIFNTETNIKNIELNKINDEIEIEFHIDNYDKNKKKYDYKETFIRNLAFEANTCDENKQDYIEFYQKKQREAEEGKEMCDSVLHNLIDEGLIKPEELPTDFQNSDQIEIKIEPLINSPEPNTANLPEKSSSKLTRPTSTKKLKSVSRTKTTTNSTMNPTTNPITK